MAESTPRLTQNHKTEGQDPAKEEGKDPAKEPAKEQGKSPTKEPTSPVQNVGKSRFGWRVWLALGAAVVVVVGIAVFAAIRHGKTKESKTKESGSGPATVRAVKPELRNMTSTVAQPGFVEAYEQTAIFSKVSGFIKEFSVDIGDEVKKDQVLCEIFVPELEQQHEQKVAQVELDVSMVKQAQQLVAMAQAHIETATAQQREAEANVGKYRAEVVRWESELRRITKMVAEKAIDKQALDETTNTVASNKSALEAALAAVAARKAATLSAETDLLKAKIDVKTAEAKVKVSEAEERRLAALLDYTKITAPYDGVITVRNANTGDYVETVAGEKTVSGHVPIFVVARTDLVRIFVDVPEQFARYVHTGTKAAIYAEDLSGQEFPATVARTSWSLHEKSRSLRVEIDLPAKKYGLRPAMYVDAKIFLERTKVRAVPQDAVTALGDQTYAFLLEDGKAVKTPVERGISDGKLTEIVKKKIGGSWLALSGQEEFIVGDLSELVDGQTVSAAAAKGG